MAGTRIEFEAQPVQRELPEPYNHSKTKLKQIDVELLKMIAKVVTIPSKSQSMQFVSNIFTRDHCDLSLRVILDLSELHEHVVYRHFKIESLQMAIELMSKDCLMASIDWKDAYDSFPIAEQDQKFLKFQWQGNLCQYTC